MAAHSCFNCGSPAGTQIANSKMPAYAKYVCGNKACWDAWYEKHSHK